MIRKIKKRYCIFILITAIIQAGTDGTIRGKVTDIDGAPLAGANIYVPDIGTGAAADLDGNYIILNIPVGGIRCSCSNDGLRKAKDHRCQCGDGSDSVA